MQRALHFSPIIQIPCGAVCLLPGLLKHCLTYLVLSGTADWTQNLCTSSISRLFLFFSFKTRSYWVPTLPRRGLYLHSFCLSLPDCVSRCVCHTGLLIPCFSECVQLTNLWKCCLPTFFVVPSFFLHFPSSVPFYVSCRILSSLMDLSRQKSTREWISHPTMASCYVSTVCNDSSSFPWVT